MPASRLNRALRASGSAGCSGPIIAGFGVFGFSAESDGILDAMPGIVGNLDMPGILNGFLPIILHPRFVVLMCP